MGVSLNTFDTPTPSILLLGNSLTVMSFPLKTSAEIEMKQAFYCFLSKKSYVLLTVVAQFSLLETKIRDKRRLRI